MYPAQVVSDNGLGGALSSWEWSAYGWKIAMKKVSERCRIYMASTISSILASHTSSDTSEALPEFSLSTLCPPMMGIEYNMHEKVETRLQYRFRDSEWNKLIQTLKIRSRCIYRPVSSCGSASFTIGPGPLFKDDLQKRGASPHGCRQETKEPQTPFFKS